MPEETTHVSANEIVAAYDLFHKKGINPEKVAQLVVQMRLNQKTGVEQNDLSDFNEFINAVPVEYVKKNVKSTRGKVKFEILGMSRIAGFRPDDLMNFHFDTIDTIIHADVEKSVYDAVQRICWQIPCLGYFFLYKDADDFFSNHRHLNSLNKGNSNEKAFKFLKKQLTSDNSLANELREDYEFSKNDRISIADFMVKYIQKNQAFFDRAMELFTAGNPDKNKYFLAQYKLNGCTFLGEL